MTKVKICGITNLGDALLSVKYGADALGFNFYKKSPRYIEPRRARKIIHHLPEEVMKVGIFVNELFDGLVEAATAAGVDTVQLHGNETINFVKQIKSETTFKVIKAVPVPLGYDPRDFQDFQDYGADAILLDAYSKESPGGTGVTIDWDLAREIQEKNGPIYLAGGLSPENVANAILRAKPFAVDVASGVESAPGKKDPKKLEAFIRNAKTA